MEKMEALAWEETLVANGTFSQPAVCLAFAQEFYYYRSTTGVHPELIHLCGELSKRSDKRLKLTPRRCAYEVNDATKGERATENAVCRWKGLSCSNTQTFR